MCKQRTSTGSVVPVGTPETPPGKLIASARELRTGAAKIMREDVRSKADIIVSLDIVSSLVVKNVVAS